MRIDAECGHRDRKTEVVDHFVVGVPGWDLQGLPAEPNDEWRLVWWLIREVQPERDRRHYRLAGRTQMELDDEVRTGFEPPSHAVPVGDDDAPGSPSEEERTRCASLGAREHRVESGQRVPGRLQPRRRGRIHTHRGVMNNPLIPRTKLDGTDPTRTVERRREHEVTEDLVALPRDGEALLAPYDEIGLTHQPPVGPLRPRRRAGRIALRSPRIHPRQDRVDLCDIEHTLPGHRRSVRGGQPGRHLPIGDRRRDTVRAPRRVPVRQ